MFESGDVVRFFSPIAGKEKFHLCLGHGANGQLFAFLHINSECGYKGDCVLEDGQVPGLPKSRTGKTVVSFSLVVHLGEAKLEKFGAVKTGVIDAHVAGELAAFAKAVPTLTRAERAHILQALEKLFI